MSFAAAPLAMVATAIGAGVQAYGHEELGKYQKGMYDYQAGVNTALAGAASTQAILARQSGEVEAQKAGMISAATKGKILAEAGASNIDPTTGSRAQVLRSQQAIGLENQALARSRAGQVAYGEDVQAASLTAQAGAEKVAGQQAVVAGDIGATASIVGGVASVSDEWYRYSMNTGGGAGTGAAAVGG